MLLITKFNRMIRSRIVWGAFAVLVSVSFVLVGYSSRSLAMKRVRAGTVGYLFGDDVTEPEFRMARFFAQGMREQPERRAGDEESWEERTWERLATLHAAKALGLSATDAELADLLSKDPSFAVNGTFSREKYRAIAENQFRVGEQVFDDFLRQEVTRRKVEQLMEFAVWTAPLDLKQRLSDLSDTFSVEYVAISNRTFRPSVQVAAADAETFFNENQERFRIPELRRVRFVRIPITNYLAQARVTPQDVLDYYDENLKEFSTSDTNEPFRALAAVSNDIAVKLQRQKATFDAKDAATEFAMALTPGRSGAAPDMRKAAVAYGLTAATTDFFRVRGNVPGLPAGDAFTRAAFDLDAADSDKAVSDAVVDGDDVYVLVAHEAQPSRIPPFLEITNEVMPAARAHLEQQAFMDKAKSIRDSVSAGMAGGASFRDAVAEFALNVSTTTPFTAQNVVSEAMPNANALVPGVVSLSKGEISDILEVPEGVLLAHVVDRTPGDLVAMELLKPRLTDALDRQRAGLLAPEWRRYLLAKAGFKGNADAIRNVPTAPDEDD